MSLLSRAVAVAAVISASDPALAHQDYAGDVHPRVAVENGQFAIYFTNNRDRSAYKMVVSTTGAVVSPRRALGKATQDGGSPVRRQHAGRSYTFPAWEREHNGKPFYLVAEGKGAARRVELPWPARTVKIVHDALVSDREIVLLATPDLQLFRFARGGGGFAKHRLGEPYRIYDFPRASNLAVHRDTVVVCWIDKAQRLLASDWAPARGKSKTVVLAPKTDWNTTLAIGVIGDVLLLAYHGPGSKGAEIKTLLRRLPL